VTPPSTVPSKTPPSPASPAEKTKTRNFAEVAEIPIDPAATSVARTEAMARPVLERATLRMVQMTNRFDQ